jgi:hypothetical protein
MAAGPRDTWEDIDMDKYEYARATEWMRPVYWIEGEPWEATSGLLRPIGRPDVAPRCSTQAMRAAIKAARVYGAQWTEDWNARESQWWYIVADMPDYDVSQFDKQTRYNIRHGMKHFEVRRVDATWLAEYGYPVYRAAVARYGEDFCPETPERYHASISGRKDIAAFQPWGAFDGDRLVAYVTCLVLEDMVHCLTSKSDPTFLNKHPNHALNYVLTQTYLCSEKMRYVTRGSRVLLHETDMQDFIQKMGYRRCFCGMKLLLRQEVELALRCGLGKIVRGLGTARIRVPHAEKIVSLEKAWIVSQSPVLH